MSIQWEQRAVYDCCFFFVCVGGWLLQWRHKFVVYNLRIYRKQLYVLEWVFLRSLKIPSWSPYATIQCVYTNTLTALWGVYFCCVFAIRKRQSRSDERSCIMKRIYILCWFQLSCLYNCIGVIYRKSRCNVLSTLVVGRTCHYYTVRLYIANIYTYSAIPLIQSTVMVSPGIRGSRPTSLCHFLRFA